MNPKTGDIVEATDEDLRKLERRTHQRFVPLSKGQAEKLRGMSKDERRAIAKRVTKNRRKERNRRKADRRRRGR